MSQSYFPASPDSTQPVGYPSDANRGYPPDGAHGYPPNTDGQGPATNHTYAPHPNLGRPAYGMEPPIPGPPPAPVKASLPRRAVAIIAVLGVVAVGLAGFAFTTHSSLAKAQSTSAELSDSLKKADASIAAGKKALAAAKEATAEVAAALEVTQACAAGLDKAWDLYFDEDYEGAGTALNEADQICEPVLGNSDQQ